MKRAVLMLVGLLVAAPAAAKDGKRVAKAPAAKKAEKAAPAQEASSDESDTHTTATATTSTSTSTSTSTKDNVKIKTKTYNFGAMDVEGKLKTPQLLYFLNRVKLELDMSAPDKRSFMKELERSADDKSL
jgi:hypothetical protein